MIIIIIIILIVFISITLRIVPIFSFPKLTGKYKVGTKIYQWDDTNRKEFHVKEDIHRQLLIQFWYPSKIGSKDIKAKYMPEVIGTIQKSLKKSKYAPIAFILHKLLPVYSNSFENSEIEPDTDKYPIIIFSHGLGGICNFSTSLIEELASHGYIVLGINHPYSCYLTVFPDGKIIPKSMNLNLSLIKILKNINNNQDHKNKDFKELEKEFDIWVEDTKFVINILHDINQKLFDKELQRYIDLKNIGIYGHSLGGALAAEICRLDSRCKAGASLDGSIFDHTLENEFQRPFLFILGVLLTDNIYPSDNILKSFNMSKLTWDCAIEKYKKSVSKLCEKIGKDGYKITIKNAGHYAFTDIALLRPFWAYLLYFDIGSWKSWHVIPQTNKYVIDFFNKYLKSENYKNK